MQILPSAEGYIPTTEMSILCSTSETVAGMIRERDGMSRLNRELRGSPAG